MASKIWVIRQVFLSILNPCRFSHLVRVPCFRLLVDIGSLCNLQGGSPVKSIPYMISTRKLHKSLDHLIVDMILVSLPALVSFWSLVPMIWLLRTSKRTEAWHVHWSCFWVSNMTPTFSHNWLIKTAIVFGLVLTYKFAWPDSSYRPANPTWLSPISPSISHEVQGPQLIDNVKVNCTWVVNFSSNFKTFVHLSLVAASNRQCSHGGCGIGAGQSMFRIDKAAIPPSFCACATAWRAAVVLPDDSGPWISIMDPLG